MAPRRAAMCMPFLRLALVVVALLPPRASGFDPAILDARFALAAAPVAAAAAAGLLLSALDEDGAPSDWDSSDPGRWTRVYDEWALGPATALGADGATRVEARGGGAWRVLLRHDSVQSATAWDAAAGAPRHGVVANEYVKVMASAAVGALGRAPASALFLGLGAGTLPMLLREGADKPRCVAVELDASAAALAEAHLGLNGVDVVLGDAAAHRELAPGAYDLVALDVYDDDNRVPAAFATRAFAAGVSDALADGGAFVANFHVGAGEDAILAEAAANFGAVFPDLARVDVRYQGNCVLLATRNADAPDAAALASNAERVARAKGWPFDPRSRLRRLRRA